MTEDEERAAQYLRDRVARERARKAREKLLRGNVAARAVLEQQWAPVRDWLRER